MWEGLTQRRVYQHPRPFLVFFVFLCNVTFSKVQEGEGRGSTRVLPLALDQGSRCGLCQPGDAVEGAEFHEAAQARDLRREGDLHAGAQAQCGQQELKTCSVRVAEVDRLPLSRCTAGDEGGVAGKWGELVEKWVKLVAKGAKALVKWGTWMCSVAHNHTDIGVHVVPTVGNEESCCAMIQLSSVPHGILNSKKPSPSWHFAVDKMTGPAAGIFFSPQNAGS